ncbi:hypothetical protein [Psychroflexus aestuariivivens]|uniref:hypothetical protein n=1 Tax=Psychroflexus aestuariivivens TaxID=1795040 RepID=UPI000FDA0F7C|nr:hypothetical protein [Psychroflexus aestuariivivens]
MLTSGQITFAIIFAVTFISIVVFTYFKDKRLHKKYYKNSIFVLVGFLVFVGILFLLKFFWKE